MKKYNALICYDIADPKRLAKVSRNLEKVAIRIQKSIFYYMEASPDDIKDIVNFIENVIDHKEDDVRIYKVDKKASIHLCSGIDLNQPNLIAGA